MPRHRYFYSVNGRRVEELIDGKWLPVSHAQVTHSHNIIRDQLGDGVRGVYNPATSKRYDSRSKYLADTKAVGGVIVGNDQPLRPRPKATVGERLETTIERLSQQKGWNL